MRLVIGLGAVAFVVGLVAGTAPADDKKRADNAAFTDASFVNKAATGGMHEIELGRLAKMNGASPEVKGFGERMIKDHTTMAEWLKTAAKAANLEVPGKLTAEQQKEVDMLSKLRGAEFDKAYTHHMEGDHQKDIALFEQASKEAKDANIKAFAAKCLPTLKEHLAHAKRVCADVKKGGQ